MTSQGMQAPPAADHASGALQPAARRLLLAGAAGAVLCFLAVGSLHLLAVPPFVPVDETSHTGYALALADGRLPTLTDDVDSRRIPGLNPDTDVWTANHAPLYYAVVAVPLAAGEAAGNPLGGFYAARAVTLLLGAVAVAGVAWVAWLLAPARPEVAVGAAAVAALVPAFAHIAAFVHNDALAIATSTGVLGTAVLALRRGLTRPRLAALAALATAAALVRASGLAAAALGVAAAGTAVLLHDRRPLLARLGRAAAGAGAVLAAVAAGSGWFYLRNLRLYGDITGAAALLERFERTPSIPVAERLLLPEFYADQHFQLWGRLAGRFFLDGPPVAAARALAALVAVGIAAALVQGALRLWRARGVDAGAAAAWLLALGWLAMLFVMIAGFGARGGGLHARYLLPGVAVLGVLHAVAMAALPGRRRGLPLVFLVVAFAAVNVAVLGRYLATAEAFDGSASPGPGAVVAALAATGVPAPALVTTLAFGCLAVGLGLAVTAIWRLAPQARRGAE